ncbi:helix-turn-helix domain-containing protein [Lacticaseibacillus jixiensis]|uniref:helix-turn-helix domain-containing protein n=1 Tax=Lacticaseibacillus jixiensis TaxID=3231926 RepID=UPI0036F24037
MSKLLAQRLVLLREAAGLSQSAVAKQIGIDNSSLSRIESGARKVSAAELAQFSAIFHVTADYLLGKDATELGVLDLKDVLDGRPCPEFNFAGIKLTAVEQAKLNLAITQIFWDKLVQQPHTADNA